MNKIYLGIDPGQKGALAMIHGTEVSVIEMPVLGNKEIDGLTIFNWLPISSPDQDVVCALEKAQAMPKQGITSTFNYGVGFGVIKTALNITKTPYIEVRPAKWKKYFSLKSDKKQAVAMASKLFPDIIFHTPRGRILDGHAEALLLAYYVKQGQV